MASARMALEERIFMKAGRGVQYPTGLVVLLFVALFLVGCASTDVASSQETARQVEIREEALSDLAKAPFQNLKRVSEFPSLRARTKISDRRVESEPLPQEGGYSFPRRLGTGIGFPATLELTNTDSVVVEITDLEIRRRTARTVGDYEPLLGADPIVLKPGESWEGTFIVSRKKGWYRVRAQSSAPEGWYAIQGEGTRKVYFQESTNPTLTFDGYHVEISFWNLSEESVAFRYWITAEEPDGVPQSSLDAGEMRLDAGEAVMIELKSPERNWTLVTAPIEEEA